MDDRKEALYLTRGLALLGLDGITMNICNSIVAFVRADEFQFSFLLLSSTSVFQIGLQFRADVFQIPQHRQALDVGCNAFWHPMTSKNFLYLNMASLQVDILNPKAGKILKDLADLNLISIREIDKNDNFLKILRRLRAKAKNNPISFSEITKEVES